MRDVRNRIDALADQLSAAGYLTDESWRGSLRAVPRHLFVPPQGYAVPGTPDGPAARAIDRAKDSDDWWRAVYGDMAVITQRDDGRTDVRTTVGTPTSSLSAPSVVLPFLELLAPGQGDRVLEIGTGTGWTAALLSNRIGDHAVTTVEVDPSVMDGATGNLMRAGYSPTLVVADGAAGHPDTAPFTKMHVTCGVDAIPYTWVEQISPGGIIVLPWCPGSVAGFKVRLVVNGDGTATGTFHGRAGYMMLRSQRQELTWKPHDHEVAERRTTRLDPREVHAAGPGSTLAIAAGAPGVSWHTATDDGFSLLLFEIDKPDGSWAACDNVGAVEHEVTQYGDRRLWDEVEAAYLRWETMGRPGPGQFHFILSPEGQDITSRPER